jgi:NTE family protein
MSWGLVLSGGAAHGLANGGIIEVLERESLTPDCVAGSSMGAIVAALYATGHSSKEMRDLCGKLRVINIATMSKTPLRNGLHGGLLRQNLEHWLHPLLGDATIGDCRIPFVCVAGRVCKPIVWRRILRGNFTEYVQGCVEKHVFPPQTRLLDALLATSAIPVLFSPMKVGDDEYIDLVSFGAVPARTLKEKYNPDVIIATDTNPRYEKLRRFLPAAWRDFIESGNASLRESLDACDLVIKAELKGSPFAFNKSMQFYEAGKKVAEQKLKEINQLIQ